MTAFINTKTKEMTLRILGFLSIALILSLNLHTFYWADDYAILNEIKEFGIFKRCLNGYFTWDGRYMTPAAFLQGAFLNYLPVPLITFIWNSCFLVSGYILYLLIKQETESKIKSYWSFIIIIGFWLGSYRHIGQTVYWATGGVYSFNLLLGALWILGFNHIQKSNNLLEHIAFVFFTIVVSLTTQNLTLGLITLLVLSLCLSYFKSDKKNMKYNIVLLLIFLAGTIFLSSAPGNFVRMKEINGANFSNITLLVLLKNFAFIIFTYLKFSFILSIMAFIIGISSFGFKMNVNLKSVVFFPNSKEKIIRFIAIYKYLLAAVSTVLPFITMPEVLSTRTAIYFMFFFFAFVVIYTERLFVSKPENKVLPQMAVYGLIYTALVFFGAYNFIKGTRLKEEITKREELLKQSKSKTVSVKVIEENMKSYCFDIRDYKDSEDWALKAQEAYFGIQKINLE